MVKRDKLWNEMLEFEVRGTTFFLFFWVQSSYHLWKDRDGDLLLLKVNNSAEIFETMNFDFFCENNTLAF